MISWLEGVVQAIDGCTVILNVQGVGYELCCSQACVDTLQIGKPATFVISTQMRESAIELYGFTDRLEKQVFLLLTEVKGVGAKSASKIISGINHLELLRMIGAGDVNRLQAVRGIGKKTAERILVELKDRVGEFAQDRQGLRQRVERVESEPYHDAIEALVALGFSNKDAERAVLKAKEIGSNAALQNSGEIVKEALRYV